MEETPGEETLRVDPIPGEAKAPRVIDLSDIAKKVDRIVVKLPDGPHEMLSKQDLDPVMIARVNVALAGYNSEEGGPVAQAERQRDALWEIVRIAVPTMPEGMERQIPFLDLVNLMQSFLEPLQGIMDDPRMAKLVEIAESRLGTST